jgi:hypothetical protein
MAATMACSLVLGLVAAILAYHGWESRQQLRMERQEHAVEKALEAAMGGHLDKAETDITEAETLEASTAKLLMLRGLVAFHRGDCERALVNLEEAVNLESDSVAARGMLAMAYLSFGDWTQYMQTTTELEMLSPRSAEDYLFKGYSQRWTDSAKSLQNLNEAVKLTHSPLALAIRADSRVIKAEVTDDLEEAELALDDIRAAKASQADNAWVLAVSVWAHVVAANLYLEAGKPEKRSAALEIAERDAQALKARDTLTFPFETLMVYFEQTGQEQACLDLGRRANERSDAPIFAYKYALALYRKGQVVEALQALERGKWPVLSVDNLRAFLLAEQHPRDLSLARAACDEMAKRFPEGKACRANVLFFLGDKGEDTSEKELLESLKVGHRSRSQRFDAHYGIAVRRLLKGDRPVAREHLREAVQTHLAFYYGTDLTRCFLARVEKDDTWPPWIPMKNAKPKP